MVNEIRKSHFDRDGPSLPSSRLPNDSGSAYNMSHGFAHGNTKGFVYYISKERVSVSVMVIMKREHSFENFIM